MAKNTMLDQATVPNQSDIELEAGQERKLTAWRFEAKLVHLLPMAAWFAILTSAVEVVCLAVKKFYLHRYLFLGEQTVWSVPLTYLVMYCLFGLVLWLLARINSRWITLRLSSFVYALLSSWIILMQVRKVALSAKLVLAIGLSVQLSYLIVRYQGYFARLVRSTFGWTALLPWILRLAARGRVGSDQPARESVAFLPSRRHLLASTGVAVAGAAAGTSAWQHFISPRRQLESSTPGSVNGPNVLLLVMDTVRAQSLSLFGYGRRTSPQMEQLARSSVLYRHALVTAGWTLCSHASMFTGRYPTELNCDFNVPLDTTYPTLAEALSSCGYDTAGFVANNNYCSRESGLARGFLHFEDFPLTAGQVFLNTAFGNELTRPLHRMWGNHENLGRKSAAQLNHDLLAWLSSRRQQKPFFAFINYFDAHCNYYPPAEFLQQVSAPKSNGYVDFSKKTFSPDEVRELNDAYDGAVAYIDHQVGRLMAELERTGVLDNTLIILCGDHGEHFGEHDLITHANSLYMQLLHVPLLVRLPSRLPQGRVVNKLVTLCDVPATIMDVIGVKQGHPFPGRSLARFVPRETEISPAAQESIFSAVRHTQGLSTTKGFVLGGGISSLVSKNLHYLKYAGGREELYDIRKDPVEQHNLAQTGDGRHALESLRAELEGLLSRYGRRRRNQKDAGV